MRPNDVSRLAETAELEANDVHVWRMSVGLCSEAMPELRALLNFDERSRADRFAVSAPRNQFTIARASLRLIVGGYLRERADALRFVYGKYGKPALPTDASLRFNVAHSGDVVLIAVSRSFDIGVDVEHCRSDVEPEEIGPQCLCPEEINRIRDFVPAKRRAAFFEYWTSKEALSKAVGSGLATPLTAIHVGDGGSSRVIEMIWRSDLGVQRWFSYRLDVGPEYSAAVAAQSPSLHITRFGPDFT